MEQNCDCGGTNKLSQESIIRYGDVLSEIPFVYTKLDLKKHVKSLTPWHWHEEFEITYVISGNLIVQTTNDEFILKPGDALFVNSRVRHRFRTFFEDEECVCFFIGGFFELLIGNHKRHLVNKYVRPIMSAANIEGIKFFADKSNHKEIIDKFVELSSLIGQEQYTDELKVCAILYNILYLLNIEFRSILDNCDQDEKNISKRLQIMITYIHDNKSNHITLEDIAKSASVSTRECNRCFQEQLNLSPIVYLNTRRINHARLLLRVSEKSITEISAECGFSTVSYFTKVFKKEIGITPREYRKLKHHKN